MDLLSVAHAMGTAGQGGSGQAGGGFAAFVPLLLMVVIFYFLLIRPQQKKQKEHRSMLSGLQKGDTVVTQGGLQGKVVGITDTAVTLEIAEKVRVKVQRGYIAALLARGEVSE
ncbi:MAG: preprotein translocase subunit YajC [Desulforhabdus sp.]|jgi:preprotein translocase subunit YajC|nr:preprotein translocase subunit YajC [Desulforhabdus sp.]